MINKIVLILLSLLLFASCDCICNSECEGIACTEQFVIITITIVDQDQNPVILDDYAVINIDNNTDINYDLNELYQSFQGEGVYPIFDDRYQQDYQNKEVELQFLGYIGGQEVVNEYYLVGADCCHVYSIDGNYNITIE